MITLKRAHDSRTPMKSQQYCLKTRWGGFKTQCPTKLSSSHDLDRPKIVGPVITRLDANDKANWRERIEV